MTILHYAIGDIHGCFEELLQMEQQLQAHARAHQAEARFFCVGDYVDRGVQIRQVLEHLFFSEKAAQYALVAGNHEAMMMDVLVLLFPERFSTLPEYLFNTIRILDLPHRQRFAQELLDYWYSQGGDRTARSLFGSLHWQQWNIPWELVQRLAQLPLLQVVPSSVALTHALVSDEELEQYQQGNFQHDPVLWEHLVSGFLWRRGIPSPLRSYRLHISGHTPLDEPRYLPDRHRLLLDTGCVYGNKLSAFCIETEEFFFVEAHRRYW